MSSHIEKYVATCDHCQRNKRYNSSTRDIPQPHDIPSRRFDVVSVDLLSGFPTTKNGYDCNVSFTDRLTQHAYISPCHKLSSAKDLDTIFMQTVFRLTLDLCLTPMWFASIIRSAFNSWVPRLTLHTWTHITFELLRSVLLQNRFLLSP